jgi:hypothetical protein
MNHEGWFLPAIFSKNPPTFSYYRYYYKAHRSSCIYAEVALRNFLIQSGNFDQYIKETTSFTVPEWRLLTLNGGTLSENKECRLKQETGIFRNTAMRASNLV